MARPLRIEFPGAFYHITARGNEQKDIFKTQKDRGKFLSYLESATQRYGAVIHVYCLMSNHYHLLVETPNGNLSQIMKHVNGSYTTYFNVKRKRAGHLLQGRYKAILVEADEYATELSRYIHLNPVRASMVNRPEDHVWGSYRAYIGNAATPGWLTTDVILGYFGKVEAVRREGYRNFVQDLIETEYRSPLHGTVASSILGSVEFVAEIQEVHLCSKKADRDLPALRELASRPSLDEIVNAVKKVVTNDRIAKKASIYFCHRYSGKKLKEIGDVFGLTESGVTRTSQRFVEGLEHDETLKAVVADIRKSLKLSIA